LRDAFSKFEANDIKLYALSYDDQAALKQFAEQQDIPFPLLSDPESRVIREYRILNTEVSRDDFLIYGIPFPGVYVCDESGVVTAKFFHDTYKKRDSPEVLIDAALGKIVLDEEAPRADGGDKDIGISVSVRGGKGTVRQGLIRHLVVRFELADGLHIYGEPVPDGMVATSIEVSGPPGLITQDMRTPPAETLHLSSMGLDLPVWSGTVDLVVPFYAVGELVSETRPLDAENCDIEVIVRYQACDDDECRLPQTERFTLNLGMDVIDIPKISLHLGHGQREGNYDGKPALRRLLWRKFKANPIGPFRFMIKSMGLERQARRRAKKTVAEIV